MRVKIWTLAVDDRFGTRATVHTTEKAAYEEWLDLQFSGDLDEDELKEKAIAAEFIRREDFNGLWGWRDDFKIGEPLDTYAIDEHEIEI